MHEPYEAANHINKSYHIYALIDPRDNLVRYVGMSENAQVRFYGHLNSGTANAREREWLTQLRKENFTPILCILEVVIVNVDDNASIIVGEREHHWIRELLGLGYPLLNMRGVEYPYIRSPVNVVRKTHKIIETTPIPQNSKLSNIQQVKRSNDDTEMLTAEEVAEQMKVNVRTVRSWVQSGELIPTWIGKREYRISKADFRAFVQKRRGPQLQDDKE